MVNAVSADLESVYDPGIYSGTLSLAIPSGRFRRDFKRICLPDIRDMSASEASPFHGVALYTN